MPMLQILHRWTGAVLFEAECESLRLAVESAVHARISLNGANLDGASLYGANLNGANLNGASLDGASLNGANLDGASLYGANLNGANLNGASLDGANLNGANLDGANLNGANLRSIRADLYDVLVGARAEAPAFLDALRSGKVDGSMYEGECACLVGTIAKTRGVSYQSIEHDSKRPIEVFLTNVRAGDTPETNQVAALVAEWTARFVGEAV